MLKNVFAAVRREHQIVMFFDDVRDVSVAVRFLSIPPLVMLAFGQYYYFSNQIIYYFSSINLFCEGLAGY